MKNSAFYFEKFFNLSPDLLCVISISGHFQYVNPAFTDILGYGKQELASESFLNFIHDDDLDLTQAELSKLEKNNSTIIYFENRYRCKNGLYRWYSWKAYFDNDTKLLYAIARDINDQKILENRLTELCRLDPLTDILNRRAFMEICLKELKSAVKHYLPISLLIIDIDYFKEYNDKKGHLQGDKILRRVAANIKEQLHRSTDLIFRYGGDEFLVLLINTSLEQALNTAEHLRRAVEAMKISYNIDHFSENLTITLGVTTIIPTKNFSVNELIAAADEALYRAKKAGRNQVVSLVDL